MQPLLSAQTIATPWHVPPPHVSPLVQALPSLHGLVLLAFTQPVAGLHESFVQPLLSLQLGAGPPLQCPPPHVSFVVQAFPSLHGLVLFVLTQPDVELHVSVVHTLLSSQLGAAPPTHRFEPLHWSAVVQKLPSLHEVPAGW